MLPALLMNSLPALSLLGQAGRLWYAAPLVVSISLVYAATRDEETRPILTHAARFAGWVVVFMLLLALALQGMGWLQ